MKTCRARRPGNGIRLLAGFLLLAGAGQAAFAAASVTFSGLVRTPTAPTILNLVTVKVDIAKGGSPLATDLRTKTWFRVGRTGPFDSVTMTNYSGNSWRTRPPIPRGDVGLMQYYIECNFGEVGTTQRYVRTFPATATNSLLGYTNTDVFVWEPFDSGWPVAPVSQPWLWSNGVYSARGWVASNCYVKGASGNPPTQSGQTPQYACWLDLLAVHPLNYLRSPLLSNGLSQLSFYSSSWSTRQQDYVAEMRRPLETNWTTIAQFSDSVRTWTYHSLYTNIPGSLYLRFRKTYDSGNPQITDLVGLDSISVSFAPAAVDISTVMIHPGYPSADQTVNVSCYVNGQKNPMFSALGVTARTYYRKKGASTFSGPVQMTLTGGRYMTQTAIPKFLARDVVEYYIESTFKGYKHSARENHSPSFYPEGTPLVSTNQYYVAPTSGFPEYTVRPYESTYDRLEVASDAGSIAMDLVDNNVWRGVMDLTSATNLTWSFQGFGQYTNGANGYGQGVSHWGDTYQNRFVLPLIGTGQPNGSNLVLNGILTGQLLFRYDIASGQYQALRCAYQNFNEWRASTDYFEESLTSRKIQLVTNNFSRWSPDVTYVTKPNQDLEDFQCWTNSGYYTEKAFSPSNGWYIQNTRIISEFGNLNKAGRLIEEANIGTVWPHLATLTPGLKTFSFDYRARADDDNYMTWYSAGTTWDSYTLTATFQAPALSPDFPYVSMFARFVNTNNYYEYRLNKYSITQLSVELWRKRNGTAALLIGPVVVNGTLQSAHVCKLVVATNNTASGISTVYLGAYLDGVRQTEYYDANALRILSPGTIGFLTVDADVLVDDISVTKTRVQRFEQWTTPAARGTYTNAGWIIRNGYVTGGYASLYTNSGGGYVSSPQIPFQPGRLSFYYWANSSVVGKGFKVLGSTDGSAWATLDTFSFSLGGQWLLRDLQQGVNGVDFSPYRYFRVQNTSTQVAPAGAEALRLNDIEITEVTNTYTESFPGTVASNWTQQSTYWYVTNNTYARPGYAAPPVGYDIEYGYTNYAAPYGPVEWHKAASFTAKNVSYLRRNYDFFQWQKIFVRIRHTSTKASLVVDNLTMSDWRGRTHSDTNGWYATESWVGVEAPGANNRLELWRSRADPDGDQYFRSPWMQAGVGTVSFDYKAAGLPARLSIQRSSPSVPTEYDNLLDLTVTNGAWARYTLNLRTNDPMYVRILHTGTNKQTILYLDNVEVTDYGFTNTTAWAAYNARITYNVNDKEFEPFYVPESAVKTCFLNNSPTSGTRPGTTLNKDNPYVQTPLLPRGVGQISFWYRSWESDGAPPGTITMRSAPSDATAPTNWVTLATISWITNAQYRYFSTNIYKTAGRFFRIYGDTNPASARVCVDNLLVAEPLSADVDLSDMTIAPSIPLFSNDVALSVNLSNFFLDPSNIDVRAYYFIGTNAWGTWTPTLYRQLYVDPATTNTPVHTYRTAPGGGIPAQAIDTVVQYYIRCAFDGMFASNASPKELREFTNPAWYKPVDLNRGKAVRTPYYVVFSCLPGQVWVNELNVVDWPWELTYSNQYVEVCGRAGIDFGNWAVEVVTLSAETTGVYRVPVGRVFQNEKNGFGFWVVGSNRVAGIDMPLRRTMPESGGIILRRSMGAIDSALAYGPDGQLMPADFTYIGYDDFFENLPLGRTGTGSQESDFPNWANYLTPFTPGGMNAGQTLLGSNPPPALVALEIRSFTASKTNIRIICNTTNGYVCSPWYNVNVRNPNLWTLVNPYTLSNNPNSTCTFWFAMPTNRTCAYRVKAVK